jgi:hypothetical protein
MVKKHLPVRYVYGESGEGEIQEISNEKVSDDKLIKLLKSLSGEKIAKLKEATELSDIAMIDEAIEAIMVQNAPLAQALSAMSGNYDYDKILAFIDKLEK